MIRNFLFILNRFKTSSILNIAGLTTALASFFIIAVHVYSQVMGSTGYGILLLFNKSYLSIFAAGFSLAIPAGYYIVGSWLDSFACKTALSWWGFALAGLPVLAVIILTVCIQCYKAATQNPAENLNSQ
jgi:hypothetical protein